MPFVTVEGIDGAGKSTVVEAITGTFDDVRLTSEPSELWTGKQVRRCLSDDSVHPLVDFYFFMGDRVHHIETEVKPYVEQGSLVVSDRYADSTRAYQPVSLEQCDYFASMEHAKIFIEFVMSPWDYDPDVTILVDVSVETALKRMDGVEKYEKEWFLTRVKRNYELLANKHDRFVVVDGEQSKEEVAEEVIEIVSNI